MPGTEAGQLLVAKTSPDKLRLRRALAFLEFWREAGNDLFHIPSNEVLNQFFFDGGVRSRSIAK